MSVCSPACNREVTIVSMTKLCGSGNRITFCFSLFTCFILFFNLYKPVQTDVVAHLTLCIITEYFKIFIPLKKTLAPAKAQESLSTS